MRVSQSARKATIAQQRPRPVRVERPVPQPLHRKTLSWIPPAKSATEVTQRIQNHEAITIWERPEPATVRRVEIQEPETLNPSMVDTSRYWLISLHAKGGFSCIYQALDLETREIVIIKAPVETNDEKRNHDYFEMVCHEAAIYEILSGIDHPLFPGYYELGNGYFVMKLLDGKTLSELTNTKSPGYENMPLYKKLEIMFQLCGLEIFHNQDLIHRDLKPGNIMVNMDTGNGKEPVVKVFDFGLACSKGHRDDEGIITGTAPFMSPEQIQCKKLDRRADIYALGLIFYKMLKGTNPMDDEDLLYTLHNQLRRNLPPLELSDIEKGIDSARAEKYKEQIEAIHFVLQRMIEIMSEKDRDNRLDSLAKIEPWIEALRDMAKELDVNVPPRFIQT